MDLSRKLIVSVVYATRNCESRARAISFVSTGVVLFVVVVFVVVAACCSLTSRSQGKARGTLGRQCCWFFLWDSQPCKTWSSRTTDATKTCLHSSPLWLLLYSFTRARWWSRAACKGPTIPRVLNVSCVRSILAD